MCGRTVLGEGWSRQQVLQDLAVLLERALHFLPGHEFTHLLGEFPEFLKPNQKEADQADVADRRVVLSCCHFDVISAVAAASKKGRF